MIVYRLSKARYKDDLSGEGAAKYGHRWNSAGVPLLYTGHSRALCATEIAVHTPYGILPDDYFMVSIYFPDDEPIAQLSSDNLPADWKTNPNPLSTQMAGDKFVYENKYLVMKVPSAAVQGDFNYLINPKFPSILQVKIVSTEPFEFDKRLFMK